MGSAAWNRGSFRILLGNDRDRRSHRHRDGLVRRLLDHPGFRCGSGTCCGFGQSALSPRNSLVWRVRRPH